MRKEKFWIATGNGRRPVEGYSTAHKLIKVHQEWSGWVLTHLPTGYAIKRPLVSREAAMKLARGLAHLDWNFRIPDSPKVQGLRAKVEEESKAQGVAL